MQRPCSLVARSIFLTSFLWILGTTTGACQNHAEAAEEPILAIPVKSFRFAGNASLTETTLTQLLASFVNKPLTLGQLGGVAAIVRDYYRNRGWILAQAYIPAQQFDNGVVEIAILEGRIDEITVTMGADAPASQNYATGLVARHLRTGEAVTGPALEAALLLLRDVPRIDATSQIAPGDRFGGAVINVQVRRDQFAPVVSGRVEIDNYGNSTSGALRLGAAIDINNPYGFGDRLSLQGFLSNATGNSYGRIAYGRLVGPSGSKVTASAARLDYALGKEFLALKPSGVGNIYAISVAEPIRRAKTGNVFSELFLEKKTVVDRIGATSSSEERGVSSLRLQLAGDVVDGWSGASDYAINLMRGKLRIEDPAQLARDQDPVIGVRTAGVFSKLSYQLQRRQPLSASLEGIVRVSGQAATANLHSSEKFAIGGEGRVRAFSAEEALGDTAYVAAAELQWMPAQLRIGKAAMSNALFYEFGHATKHYDNSALKDIANTRQIAGYGVSMNLDYGGRFLLSIALAWQHRGATDGQVAHGARAWAKASFGL